MGESNSILNRIGFKSCGADRAKGKLSTSIRPQPELRSCYPLYATGVSVFDRNDHSDNTLQMNLPCACCRRGMTFAVLRRDILHATDEIHVG